MQQRWLWWYCEAEICAKILTYENLFGTLRVTTVLDQRKPCPIIPSLGPIRVYFIQSRHIWKTNSGALQLPTSRRESGATCLRRRRAWSRCGILPHSNRSTWSKNQMQYWVFAVESKPFRSPLWNLIRLVNVHCFEYVMESYHTRTGQPGQRINCITIEFYVFNMNIVTHFEKRLKPLWNHTQTGQPLSVIEHSLWNQNLLGSHKLQQNQNPYNIKIGTHFGI